MTNDKEQFHPGARGTVHSKACPQCGYEGTKTHRQLMLLYRKHFGDIPVWEMLHRGWITGIDEPKDSQTNEIVSAIRQELIRFFEMESETELDGFIAGTFDPLSRMIGKTKGKA